MVESSLTLGILVDKDVEEGLLMIVDNVCSYCPPVTLCHTMKIMFVINR